MALGLQDHRSGGFMKARVIVGGLGVLLGFALFSSAEYHVFTSRNGQAIEAKLVKYDPHRKMVTLKTRAHETARIKVAGLSEDDQAYVRSWHAQDIVASPYKLRVDAEKEVLSKERSASSSYMRESKRVGYKVTLTNASTLPVEGLRIEYMLFYKQELSSSGKNTRTSAERGSKVLQAIPAGRQVSFTTDGVTLKKVSYRGCCSSGTRDASLRGIWMRFYVGESGEMVREMSIPAKLMTTERWGV
jgi:hypothetical protein